MSAFKFVITNILPIMTTGISSFSLALTYKNNRDIAKLNNKFNKINQDFNYTKHELIEIDNTLEMTCINIENLSDMLKK